MVGRQVLALVARVRVLPPQPVGRLAVSDAGDGLFVRVFRVRLRRTRPLMYPLLLKPSTHHVMDVLDGHEGIGILVEYYGLQLGNLQPAYHTIKHALFLACITSGRLKGRPPSTIEFGIKNISRPTAANKAPNRTIKNRTIEYSRPCFTCLPPFRSFLSSL